MTEELAAKVSELNKKLVITKNLMQNESRAIIPDSYLANIKYLVNTDVNARTDFYKVISALAIKYNKLYKERLRKL
jgi:hypothetical protein